MEDFLPMITLLQSYSIHEILIFAVVLALAIKSLISFFDWIIEKLKKIFNKQYKKINQKESIEKRLEMIKSLQKQQQRTDQILKVLSEKIDMLIESDRDDIRSYITKEHHYFCYQKKWIDDFSLDCIEKQYTHYVDEGGNSFIKGFMDELRSLPKQDPNG